MEYKIGDNVTIKPGTYLSCNPNKSIVYILENTSGIIIDTHPHIHRHPLVQCIVISIGDDLIYTGINNIIKVENKFTKRWGNVSKRR